MGRMAHNWGNEKVTTNEIFQILNLFVMHLTFLEKHINYTTPNSTTITRQQFRHF